MSVIAKETFSAVVKHAREIDESASDVVGEGIVSQMMFSRDKLWRAMLSSFSTSREGWLHGEVVAFVSHEQDWSSLPKSQIAAAPT